MLVLVLALMPMPMLFMMLTPMLMLLRLLLVLPRVKGRRPKRQGCHLAVVCRANLGGLRNRVVGGVGWPNPSAPTIIVNRQSPSGRHVRTI